MKSRFFLSLIVACGAAPLAFGSVYVPNFNGSLIGAPVNGVDGWTQSEPNILATTPLSWVSSHAGQKAGTVGAYYDVPSSDPFYIKRTIGGTLVGSTLQLRFGVQDSTTLFASRNNFSIQILNGVGTNLFSLVFVPSTQAGPYDDPVAPNDPVTANSQWNMNWSTGVTSDAAFGGIIEDGSYTMDLSFVQDGSDVDFTLSITGVNNYTETGTLTGLSAENLSELRIGMTQGAGAAWGDNFFAFTAIPEPTSAVLLGLGSFALLRRRRH